MSYPEGRFRSLVRTRTHQVQACCQTTAAPASFEFQPPAAQVEHLDLCNRRTAHTPRTHAPRSRSETHSRHLGSHSPVPAISAYTPGWMFQPGSQSRSCMPNSAPQEEPTMREGMKRPPGMATPAPTLMSTT